MNYCIPEELANKVLTYLNERPYKEVFELINGLMGMKTVTILPDTQEKGGDENVQSSKASTEESNGSHEENQGSESNG